MNQTESIKVVGDNVTVDLLIWRRFKTRTPKLVERTLELNPGLADAGFFIPPGTVVLIPIDPPSKSPVQRKPVRLWGRPQ